MLLITGVLSEVDAEIRAVSIIVVDVESVMVEIEGDCDWLVSTTTASATDAGEIVEGATAGTAAAAGGGGGGQTRRVDVSDCFLGCKI